MAAPRCAGGLLAALLLAACCSLGAAQPSQGQQEDSCYSCPYNAGRIARSSIVCWILFTVDSTCQANGCCKQTQACISCASDQGCISKYGKDASCSSGCCKFTPGGGTSGGGDKLLPPPVNSPPPASPPPSPQPGGGGACSGLDTDCASGTVEDADAYCKENFGRYWVCRDNGCCENTLKNKPITPKP